MSTPESALDGHLEALFGSLDTSAGFDGRLLSRLRAEPQTDRGEWAMRARQRELVRYRLAVSELQGWHRSMLRLLTLDTLGIALLLGFAVSAAWPRLRGDVMDLSVQYGPYLATLLGILIAAVPLSGMWAEQTRRPIRLF